MLYCLELKEEFNKYKILKVRLGFPSLLFYIIKKVMKTKNPRFGICQDCVEKFAYKKLVSFNVESKFGPDHSINLCKTCNDKRTNK